MYENRNHILAKTIIGICLIFMIGCESQEPEEQQILEDLAVSDAGIPMEEGGQSNRENIPEETSYIPTLPDTGDGLMDFVPEGWTLRTSI